MISDIDGMASSQCRSYRAVTRCALGLARGTRTVAASFLSPSGLLGRRSQTSLTLHTVREQHCGGKDCFELSNRIDACSTAVMQPVDTCALRSPFLNLSIESQQQRQIPVYTAYVLYRYPHHHSQSCSDSTQRPVHSGGVQSARIAEELYTVFIGTYHGCPCLLMMQK